MNNATKILELQKKLKEENTKLFTMGKQANRLMDKLRALTLNMKVRQGHIDGICKKIEDLKKDQKNESN